MAAFFFESLLLLFGAKVDKVSPSTQEVPVWFRALEELLRTEMCLESLLQELDTIHGSIKS